MIKQKSNEESKFQNFINMINTQYNAKAKKVWSDDAKELSFTKYLNERGIIHQFSCIERPQQNSVVEQEHQHPLNVARALFYESNTPRELWDECVLTVVFLINKTPSEIIKYKTPYELLHDSVANYSRFQTFRCLAYASTLQSQRTKFLPRAVPCVFIRHPPYMKGCKLYELSTKRILISRDVIFHEDQFPSLEWTKLIHQSLSV